MNTEQGDDVKVRVTVRQDEAEHLRSDRCSSCGHLLALHNYHCCEFCMVCGEDCG